MSLGGGVVDGARPGGRELDRRRGQLRDRGRQLATRTRATSSPARVASGDHGRLDDQHRRALVVLELRHVRRPVRPGLEHHLGLVDVATRRRTRSAGRRWRRRTSPGRSRSTCRRTRPPRRRRRRRRCSRTRRRTRSRARAPARRTGCSTRSSAAAAAGDTTPPTTSITSPASGATVSGTVTVAANASDSVGVSRVELFVDGSLAGTDTSSPVLDRVEHDHGAERRPLAADAGLRRGRQRRLERGRRSHRQQRRPAAAS